MSNEFPFDNEPTPHEPEQPDREPPEYEQPVYDHPPLYEQPPVYEQPPMYDPYGQMPPQRPKKKHTGLLIAVIALCCALLGGAIGAAVTGFVLEEQFEERFARLEATTETVPQLPQYVMPILSEDGALTPAEIYTANVPAIVGISNESTGYNIFGQSSAIASTGTGFLISADGEILTNYHVVENAQTLTVTLCNGADYPATVLGYDAESDVALLKIEASGLPTVTLGSSATLAVGSGVAAIGNPLGELTYSMTVGYLSATDREINTDGTPINMMQIDAAINPGNSGGPLFNMKGEVIGITTAKYSGTTSGGTSIEGIGFAIPIDDVLALLDDLRENGGVVDRAYIGITPASVTAGESEAYGLPMGVLVTGVQTGSSGERAGLKKSDIITALDDHRVESYEDLASVLKKYRAGDEAVLTVYRAGRELHLDIIFDAKPQETATETPTQPTEPTESDDFFGDSFEGWGFPWSFLP